MGMTLTFDDRVIVPVADPEDAERTTTALAPRLDRTSTVIIVHVIENDDGQATTPREEYANEILDRACAPLEGSDATVETETLYGDDVVATIFDAAETRDASAIAFTPREGGRITEWLTGNMARRLIREGSVPVIALPKVSLPRSDDED